MTTDGFLNLLKPPGMTSHDVVVWARAQFGIPRVGHLGTLDPAAAGVLPLSLGRATRLFSYASGPDKAYRAEIVFGLQTDTLDAQGTVIGRDDASGMSRERLLPLLAQFVGEIVQTTPSFSSASVGGRRMHRSARAGAPVVGRPRQVTIKQLDLVDFLPGKTACALVDVVCTAGTYIRALADDLGRAAGCGALLGFLVRTRAGRFTLADAHTLEEIAESMARAGMEDLVSAPDWPLADMAQAALSPTDALSFVRGRAVAIGGQPAGRWRAYGPGGQFLGVGELGEDGVLRPRVVLRSEQELTA